jgi:anti-sigma factor RsiW
VSAENDLTCAELVELVTDYLEDALPPSERVRFDKHLGGCTGCRAYLDQMRATIRLVGHLTEDDVPAAAKASLLTAFRDWKQRG